MVPYGVSSKHLKQLKRSVNFLRTFSRIPMSRFKYGDCMTAVALIFSLVFSLAKQ